MNKNTLKVGDAIYATDRNRIINVYKVIRLTTTQAVCDGQRFRIEYGKTGWVDIIGKRSSFSTKSYHIGTPELHKRYMRQQAIDTLSFIKYNELPDEIIFSLVRILKQQS